MQSTLGWTRNDVKVFVGGWLAVLLAVLLATVLAAVLVVVAMPDAGRCPTL